MSRREIYESLSRVVPREPEQLLHACEAQVIRIRDALILKQRHIILLQLGTEANYPRFFPSSRVEFLEHINRGTEFLARSISPQHLQFIYKFYEHFVHNPMDLVTAVLAAVSTPAYLSFVAYSVVPSFFGFFSTQEHLSYAFSFYHALISRAPRDLTQLMLQPFFCNACGYRYIEAIASDLIGLFSEEFGFERTPHSLTRQSDFFLNSILTHLRLLPTSHLKILTILERSQWPPELIFDFFLHSFLAPQLEAHLENSPLSTHLDLFPTLVRRLSETAKPDRLFRLFECDSIFEIPQAYMDFNDPSLAYLATPFDVSMLLEIGKNAVTLPKLLAILHSPKYLGAQPYAPVWVRVFPRNPAPALACETWRNVVFGRLNQIEIEEWQMPHFERRYRMVQMMADRDGMSPLALLDAHSLSRETRVLKEARGETAVDLRGVCAKCVNGLGLCENCLGIVQNRKAITFYEFALNMELAELRAHALSFERLLVHRFILQRLEIWGDLIEAAHRDSMNGNAARVIIGHFQGITVHNVLHAMIEPSELLKQVSPLFDSVRNRQAFWAMRAEILLSAYRQVNELMQLGREWTRTMQRVFSETPMPDRFREPRMKGVFHRILELINTLVTTDGVRFSRRYFRMIEVFRWLHFIEECFNATGSLFEYAVALCQSKEFIPTVVKISALLIKNTEFRAASDKQELLLWYKFEAVIMSRIQSDPTLFAHYSQIHDRLLFLL
jgi:hypothetical protein